MNTTISKKQRVFLPAAFEATNQSQLKSQFQNLLDLPTETRAELELLIDRCSELDCALEEAGAWCYIHMSCDTTDDVKQEAFMHFVRQIEPLTKEMTFKLKKQIRHSPAFAELDSRRYQIYTQLLERNLKLFRDANIALEAEDEEQASTFGKITGAMTVKINQHELTLQQAGLKLEAADRELRESTWRTIWTRRIEDAGPLDELLSSLIQRRTKIARNAGFDNFRDFKHEQLARFDYNPQDCLVFHDSIEKTVVPVIRDWHQERKEKLKLKVLRPWDLSVDTESNIPLKPFRDTKQLVQRSIECLSRLAPELGNVLSQMQTRGHLDLESRKGKAPGGYNYPLYESGYPFIFMNAAGSHSDLVTMIHESGHAIHAVLTHDEELAEYKDCPSESAELASMAMEMLSLPHWDLYYNDPVDLRRARRQQLMRTLDLLPWVAQIDAFQHWMYTNPDHSLSERHHYFAELTDRFASSVDWSDLAREKSLNYQKQSHIFGVPFYYIEYAIAQLGALQVWQNSLRDPEQALQSYLTGLKLGYSRPLNEVYEACGVQLNFSSKMLGSLVDSVKTELAQLDN